MNTDETENRGEPGEETAVDAADGTTTGRAEGSGTPAEARAGADRDDPAPATTVGEELATVDRAAGEELVLWTPDGAHAVDPGAVPRPGTGEPELDPEAAEAPSREAIRAEVLGDVTAYFAAADPEAFAPLPTEAFVESQWFDFDYLDGYVELDREWVNEPYAYVSVLYDDERKELRYRITEPALDPFEEYVREDLTRILRDSLLYRDVDEDADRKRLFETEAKSIIADHARTVDGGSLYKLLYYLTRDFVDYGQIDPAMRDDAIEDVSCDGADVPVFVYHREYRDLKSNVSFRTAALDSFTVRLAQKAGKSISISNPLVDASLPDGSRIQLTLGGEVSTRGSNFTIRKFSDVPYTPVDLIESNTFSVEEMAYFWLAIENNRSLIFAGGTGSGKTTSLNAVSFFVPPNSKVVSIEDTREITLPHDNWIQSVTRSAITEGGRGQVDMYQLLQSALRQRPEYLLVGEIRTEARVALTFFQAIGTGHTAYTTIHADSIEGVMARLQNEPLSIPAQMIGNLDVVSIQRQIRTDETRVRRNQAVVEVLPGGEGEEVATRTVFRRDAETDVHERVADSHLTAAVAADRGWSDDRIAEELAAREEVLQYLVDEGVDSYADVTALIHTFSKDPDYVLERIRAGDLTAADLDAPGDEGADDPEAAAGIDDATGDAESEDADSGATAPPDADGGEGRR
jgi:flagellar protein FlaI